MDFREFSEAYNNYLMHAGTNNGVNIGRLTELLKKYKKQSPPEKHPKIDQLSRIVIQQAQNGNLEQAREAAQDFNRIIPGSPSSMLFQAIINELTKPQPTYRMADSVPRPITGKRLSHSNDFREFSEEYNDYLMHAGISIGERARGKNKDTPREEARMRDYRLVARYVTDPAMKQTVLSGKWLHRNFEEALAIAKGGYNDETKTRMIMQLIRDPYNKYVHKV